MLKYNFYESQRFPGFELVIKPVNKSSLYSRFRSNASEVVVASNDILRLKISVDCNMFVKFKAASFVAFPDWTLKGTVLYLPIVDIQSKKLFIAVSIEHISIVFEILFSYLEYITLINKVY